LQLCHSIVNIICGILSSRHKIIIYYGECLKFPDLVAFKNINHKEGLRKNKGVLKVIYFSFFILHSHQLVEVSCRNSYKNFSHDISIIFDSQPILPKSQRKSLQKLNFLTPNYPSQTNQSSLIKLLRNRLV